MHVLVLAPSPTRTLGVDLASGAFVRMDHPAPRGERVKTAPREFDVAVARVGTRPENETAIHRESVVLDQPLSTVGRMSKRKVERILRPLQHVPGSSLLGCEGPAVPMWDLETLPGVAIVRPEGDMFIDVNENGVWAMFNWKRHTHRVRVEDRRLFSRLDWFPETPVAANKLGPALGFVPRRLVLSFTDPVNGYCYKAVSALLR